MCLPGNENRADDHDAMCVYVVWRQEGVCAVVTRIESQQSVRQAVRGQEGRMSRVYDNTRVSHGQSNKWRRGWRRAENDGFCAFTTPSSPSPHRVHVEERTLDRVFRRHPLPGALEDLMSHRHSLYGRLSSGNGQIMGTRNLNTGLRHIYMHQSLPIYKSRLVEMTTLTSRHRALP